MTDTTTELGIKQEQGTQNDRERIWKEKTNPLTYEAVRKALGSHDFQQSAAGATFLTSFEITEKGTSKKEVETEFGFVGLRSPDSQEIKFSAVVEGTEDTTRLGDVMDLSLMDWQNPEPPITSFVFHTHPTEEDGVSDIFSMMYPSMDTSIFVRSFSREDLQSLRRLTERGDPTMIDALAFVNPDGKTGTILLVSFGSLDSFVNFDPTKVEKMVHDYAIKGKNPFDAYRKAGLNVAGLNIDLDEKAEVLIEQDEIDKVARVLTTRIS